MIRKLQSGSPPLIKCVYTHSRRGKVFYVGLGSLSRAYATRGRPSGWHEACPDLKFKVQICAENLSQAQAAKLEEELYLKHCGSGRLTNKPIIAPGVNSLEQWSWNASVHHSKLSGPRAIDVPWMMLDSYSSPEQPFRMAVEINGVRKRFFSKDISSLFNDFCRYVLHERIAAELFVPKSKSGLSRFIGCYEFWIANGSKRFLRKYADPTRYRETLEFYTHAVRWRSVTRSESLKQYHADCTSKNPMALWKFKGVSTQNHKLFLAQLRAKYLERFGSRAEG